MDIWWSLHLRREPASVPLARHILLGTMASVGVDPDVSHEVGVALTEACANAVEHSGRAAGAEDGGFQVTATIEDGCLRVEITNAGPGFASGAAPARVRTRAAQPSGRGRRHRRRPVPDRSFAVLDDLGLDDLALDDFAPFTGIPSDAGTELPDLDATSGRGLFLIRALMDHVQFRDHPRSGAVVSFDKVLKFRESPLLHAS